MDKSRALRLGAAGILLISVGAILMPAMTSYVSTSAVVNAPLITIRSPYDGRISQESPRVASLVPAGARLVEVDGDRAARDLLTGLQAEGARWAREFEALAREQAALGSLSEALESREGRHRALGLDLQAAQAREVAADLAAARSSLREVSQRMTRTASLVDTGRAPAATLEREQVELDAITAEVDRQVARLDASRVAKKALGDGIALDGSFGEGATARQQLDDITMRRADLATQAARAEAQVAAIGSRIAAAGAHFGPDAAKAGVVWRASAARGSQVVAGEEVLKLVDCDRRFIEVAVSESHFESIVPGALAQVRLRGGSETFQARVDAVRGSGAKPDHPDLSSEPPQVAEGQLRVYVSLDPVDLEGEGAAASAAAFCDVGRTAEVRFDRSVAGDLKLFGSLLPWRPRTQVAVVAD